MLLAKAYKIGQHIRVLYKRPIPHQFRGWLRGYCKMIKNPL
jgi:hypothetical protein